MSATRDESPDTGAVVNSNSADSEAHALLQRYGSLAAVDAHVETQRRRHRENMSRYRHKKKATLDDMRVRQRVLAAQLESMLVLHASQSPSYQSFYQQQLLDDDNDDERGAQRHLKSSSSPNAMDTFVHLLTEKDRLEKANAELRRRVREHRDFHAIVRETSHEDSESKNIRNRRDYQDELKPKPEDTLGRWVTFVEGEAPFYYTPLSETQCLAMVTQTLQQVFEFQVRGMDPLLSNVPQARVVRFFDWTARLQVEWDPAAQVRMMRFQFVKSFRNSARSIDQAVADEWRVLHNPRLYQELHCMPVKSQVLQRINANLSVMLLSAPHPTKSLRFRSVSVISKTAYQDPRGSVGSLVTMAKQRVDLSAHVTSSGEHVEYLSSGFLGTAFMPGGGADREANEIDVEYIGLVPVLSDEQARFLMVGLGSALVRLEALLFSVRMLGPS